MSANKSRLPTEDPPAAEILSRLGPKSPSFGAVGRGTGGGLTSLDVAHALGTASERLGAAIAGIRYGGLKPDWDQMEALCQRRCDLLADQHDWPDMPTWRRNEMARLALEEVTFTMPPCGVCMGAGEREVGVEWKEIRIDRQKQMPDGILDYQEVRHKEVPVMRPCPSCGGAGKWSLNDKDRVKRLRMSFRDWTGKFSGVYQSLLVDLVTAMGVAVQQARAAMRGD